MRLVTAEEMRLIDKTTINEYGIPGVVLMENAGQAVARQAEAMLGGLKGKKAAIFCGGGNNGGDGLVAARHMYNHGCDVHLFFLNDPEVYRGDALINYQVLCNMGVSGLQITEGGRLNVARMALATADIAVDAIFGTGLHDAVRDLNLSVINLLNESETPVIACDIPSGLSSLTGQPLGAAVRAAVTVTFGYCKLGMALPCARPYVGQLIVEDISLPDQIADRLENPRELIDATFCDSWLEHRQADSNKGNFGHVGVVAGSPNMPGAAVLATAGALKMGAGRVTAALPAACPEAMLLDVAENEIHGMDIGEISRLVDFPADAWLIGPGMGREPQTLEVIRELVAQLRAPMVLDADALFAVCGYLRLLKRAQAPIVITPHPGEMAKLLGVSVEEVQSNRVELAESFAKQTDTVVVLKGVGTVIAAPEGRIFINNTGNPGMATAGAGDVLAGMVATLLAQGMVPAVAAACAVWLHGHAGDLAAAEHGMAGLLAGDIMRKVPDALKSIGR